MRLLHARKALDELAQQFADRRRFDADRRRPAGELAERRRQLHFNLHCSRPSSAGGRSAARRS